MTYRYKDNVELAWAENKQRLALAVKQMANRVLNEVWHKANLEYLKAAEQGKVITIDCSPAEVAKRLNVACAKMLK